MIKYQNLKETSPLVINNVFRKMVLAFLFIAFTLTIVTSVEAAGLTFGREKLKGTSKTMGDFNLESRCGKDDLACRTAQQENLKGNSKTMDDFNLQARCPEDKVTCGTACVNVQTDSHNCSACGVVCARGEVCKDGVCSSGSAPKRIIK